MDGELEYEVEAILHHRGKGARLYLHLGPSILCDFFDCVFPVSFVLVSVNLCLATM